jgi:hypothetical protein
VFGFLYELDRKPSEHISWRHLERDHYGYVEFVDMQSVSVLFNEKPSFIELVARDQEELHCHGDDDDDGIVVDGVLHLGSPPNILRKMIPIR